MRLIERTAVLFACLLPIAAVRADVGVCGNWKVSSPGAGLGEVSYGGRRILNGLSLAYFSSDYKKTHFQGSDAKFTFNGDTATLSKGDGVAESRLTIAFERDVAKFLLEVEIKKESGCLEYILNVPVEDYRWEDGNFCMETSTGVVRPMAGKPFGVISTKGFTFQTPQVGVEYACPSGQVFSVQDYRATVKGLARCVMCYRNLKPGDRLRVEHSCRVADGFDAETERLRRETYGRDPGKVSDLLGENPGFEEGDRLWQCGKVVEDVVCSGRRSMTLKVDDPMKDPVYVLRKVPVVAGHVYRATCKVKTEGVEPAPGKMDCCGAGLLVEWLDKDGAWFQPGTYATGLFGTNDWTERKVDEILAPKGAGYAMIYLTLRAKGQAWFDDVTFGELSREVSKVQPRLGERIRTNCPKFTWNRLNWIRDYRLEVSRDSSFRQGVRSYRTGAKPEFQVTDPLEPGAWYWRVLPIGNDVCMEKGTSETAWKFEQTVPQDLDCLPPTIVTKAKRLLRSDKAVEVKVTDNVGVVSVTLGGRSGRVLKDNTYRFVPPSGGWPLGLSDLVAEATDAAGNKSRSVLWLLNRPAPANAVKIGKSGCYEQAGKRIFPIGIYQVSTNYFADVRASGFDIVHSYDWEWTWDNQSCRRYLDACWATDGLRAFIGFVRGSEAIPGILQGAMEPVARRVGALADHPGLFAWYLFDEPEGHGFPADSLIDFANLIRELDPYHPVVVTDWGPAMMDYRPAWDTHWTQAYEPPPKVVARVAEHRKFLQNSSPITVIAGCYDPSLSALRAKGVEPDPKKFKPDAASLRASAFVSVTERCNGLMWWWFARDVKTFYTAAMVPELWAEMGRACHDLAALKPILNDPSPALTGYVGDQGDTRVTGTSVRWWYKSVRGKGTLIAVNTSEKPQEVEIDIPGVGKQKMSFERYEVKVTSLDKAR